MRFEAESWSEVKDEAMPLLVEHWLEMPFDIGIPLDLDAALYEQMEASGRLLIVAARDKGRLVGYFANFLARHPHYDILTAAMDVYFLLPEYRAGANGLRLFAAAEQACRERGVGLMLATARLDRNPAAQKLFERLGWTAARTVMQKRMG
jgi:GNAT superfamily N-acetyltransferase